MTRHIGKHNKTNEQLVISYMLLPASPANGVNENVQNALVTYSDKLPEPLRREIMQAVSSIDAQRTETLADLLGRKTYADSGKSLLQVLHEAKRLVPMSIDDIDMTPDGNHRVPLRTVLEAIQKIMPPNADAKFNPHTYNTVAEGQQEQVGVARNLIVEAEMLEADARSKRAQAYKLAPSLNPANKVSAPAVVDGGANVG